MHSSLCGSFSSEICTPMRQRRERGFTLIEVMVVVVIIAILAAIAYPSYRDHIIRSSRSAAQTELLELSSVEEKIYLNANAYSGDVAGAYNGNSSGGLGKTSGKTDDGKYTLTLVTAGQSYTLTATPVAGSIQQNDGAFSISSDASRLCVAPVAKWCTNSGW